MLVFGVPFIVIPIVHTLEDDYRCYYECFDHFFLGRFIIRGTRADFGEPLFLPQLHAIFFYF